MPDHVRIIPESSTIRVNGHVMPYTAELSERAIALAQEFVDAYWGHTRSLDAVEMYDDEPRGIS